MPEANTKKVVRSPREIAKQRWIDAISKPLAAIAAKEKPGTIKLPHSSIVLSEKLGVSRETTAAWFDAASQTLPDKLQHQQIMRLFSWPIMDQAKSGTERDLARERVTMEGLHNTAGEWTNQPEANAVRSEALLKAHGGLEARLSRLELNRDRQTKLSTVIPRKNQEGLDYGRLIQTEDGRKRLTVWRDATLDPAEFLTTYALLRYKKSPGSVYKNGHIFSGDMLPAIELMHEIKQHIFVGDSKQFEHYENLMIHYRRTGEETGSLVRPRHAMFSKRYAKAMLDKLHTEARGERWMPNPEDRLWADLVETIDTRMKYIHAIREYWDGISIANFLGTLQVSGVAHTGSRESSLPPDNRTLSKNEEALFSRIADRVEIKQGASKVSYFERAVFDKLPPNSWHAKAAMAESLLPPWPKRDLSLTPTLDSLQKYPVESLGNGQTAIAPATVVPHGATLPETTEKQKPPLPERPHGHRGRPTAIRGGAHR